MEVFAMQAFFVHVHFVHIAACIDLPLLHC